MKHLLRIYAFLAVCLIAAGSWAQSWTASAPGEGTFYLYNVGNDAFLYGANDWGTRASLTKDFPMALTFTSGTDGGYYISTSPVFNSRYLGSDGYVDKESSSSKYTTWLFTPVEGQENVYTMKAGNSSGNYLYAHSSDATKTSVGTSLSGSTKDYWKLVSREAWIAAMANATEDNPMDVTFLVQDAFFGKGTDYNTVWNGSVALGGPDNNNCAERFSKASYDIHQTITGIPNGIYKMTCSGFYRFGLADNAASNREAGTEPLNAKYYINSTEGSLKSIFDDDITLTNNSTYNTSTAVTVNGTSYYLPNNMTRAAACFANGNYVNELIRAVVADGTVTIGLRKSVEQTDDWAIFDNVKLYYYGVDLEAMAESYETQLATAKSLQAELMQASVKAALDEAVTTAETGVDKSSQAWLENALSVLGTAIADAQASSALYAGGILTAVNTTKAQSTSDDVKAAVQTNYDNGGYATAADVFAYYQQLEIAALGTAENTVFTSVLINPDFEKDQLGWTGSPAIGGTDTNKSAEKWNSTFDIYQTVSGLPNGYYKMTIQGFYRVGDGTNDATAAAAAREAGTEVLLTDYYLNDASGKLGSIFDSELTKTNNSTYNTSTAVTIGGTDYYVPDNMARAAACFTEGEYQNAEIQGMVTDGTLRIGVRKSTGNSQDWTIWDNIQLTYVGSYAPSSYNDVAIELNIENDEVTNYLKTTPYTESTATVIPLYNTNAGARNDQPSKAQIFLPAQTADATLYVGTSSEYTGAKTFTIPAGTDYYEVSNFLPNQTYYYKVVGDDDAIVSNGTIATSGALRMIKADGISNMRDLGGWVNADGNAIKYGKIFRGSELAAGKTYTASAADLAMLKDELDIAAEVDLREDVDFANGLMSGSAIDGATYYYANLNQWSEDALNFKTETFREGFNLILEALKAGHAAYFHCIFGADRTGCFAFLLEGLLGLSVDQLYKDYELTSFSSAGTRNKTGIDHKLQYIKALQGETLQEKFYNYWRGAVGISEADLNAFLDIMIDGTSPITAGTLAALPEKAVADGEYYIYFPSFSKFLGRGETYGARGLGENYGVPVEIATNGANVTTIKFLDSKVFFGSDCYTDKAASYNTASWFIEKNGDDLVLHSHNGSYVRVTTEENGLIKPRANVATAAEATPFVVKSAAEQKEMVAATQQANVLAAAEAAGITATDLTDFQTQLSEDYTAVASTATIKSATAGNKDDWTLTAVQGSTYNIGSYGAELYQTTGTVSQTVTVPHAGLYKLTLNALYRQGSNSTCYALGQKGYELSNAYVSVNDTYFAQIPSWYSGCASDVNPNSTGEATSRFSAGKYQMEVYAFIGDEKTATITINVPGYVGGGWCLFNNFALTEYAKNMTISETDEVAPEVCDFAKVTLTRTLKGEQWNGLSLPFSLSAAQLADSPLVGAEIKQYAELADNVMTLSTATEIVAGDPYLIKPAADVANPVFTGVAVTNPEEAVKGEGDYKLAAHLYNTTLPTDGSVAYVSTVDSKIKKLTSGGIKGLRSYFQIPTGSEAKALVLKFDDSTGIAQLREDGEVTDGAPIYNVVGQRLQKAQRGVNIVGGKKVIMK